MLDTDFFQITFIIVIPDQKCPATALKMDKHSRYIFSVLDFLGIRTYVIDLLTTIAIFVNTSLGALFWTLFIHSKTSKLIRKGFCCITIRVIILFSFNKTICHYNTKQSKNNEKYIVETENVYLLSF